MTDFNIRHEGQVTLCDSEAGCQVYVINGSSWKTIMEIKMGTYAISPNRDVTLEAQNGVIVDNIVSNCRWNRDSGSGCKDKNNHFDYFQWAYIFDGHPELPSFYVSKDSSSSRVDIQLPLRAVNDIHGFSIVMSDLRLDVEKYTATRDTSNSPSSDDYYSIPLQDEYGTKFRMKFKFHRVDDPHASGSEESNYWDTLELAGTQVINEYN